MNDDKMKAEGAHALSSPLGEIRGGLTFTEVTDCRQVCTEDVNRLLLQLSPTSSPIDERDLKEIINAPSSRLFVLHKGVTAIAMASIGTYLTPTGKKAWLEDVVVDEDFRGQGLGKMLVQKVIEHISQEGNMTLMLTSRPKRLAANSLYRGIGFERKETNVYRMKLAQG